MKERERVIEQLHNQIKKLGEAKIMNDHASFGPQSSYQMNQNSTVEAQGNGRMTTQGNASKNSNYN